MSTFNSIVKQEAIVPNHEGVSSYRMSPEMELYTAVVTASLSPKFYETAKECIERIVRLVAMCEPLFVAQLAVYARRKMNLRSVPLLLVVELARMHNGDDLVARTVDSVVMRADEIMELLVCYQWRNPSEGMKRLGHLSRQIQNGLKRAFCRFDEYQFAKYDRNNLEVKLRDALFLVHPKATDDAQQKLFDKIANRALQTPYTWETELSEMGKQPFASDEERRLAFSCKWQELIASGQLGYMAMLRNLRNMLDCSVPEVSLATVLTRLADADEVARSKQFPFRFLSAYKEIRNYGNPEVEAALEAAAWHSGSHIPDVDGKRVFIASDMSGSMQRALSQGGSVMYFEVGNMLAMLLKSRCRQVAAGIFGDEWKLVDMPDNHILANTASLNRRLGEVGYGTSGHKPLEWLVQHGLVVDKVMFFSDMQFWGMDHYSQRFTALWRRYKQVAPAARLYLFDLCGYGQTPLQIHQHDVYCIAGWNDRIFELLSVIDRGKEVVGEIRKLTV